MGPFRKHSRPVLQPSESGLDSKNVYNMAAVRENGTTSMLYRGESAGETAADCSGRLFLARSQDGVHFTRRAEPVMVPEFEYETRGVEDPRMITLKPGELKDESGRDVRYLLTYTAYDGKLARLCLATSDDLVHWNKRGPIFPKFPVEPGNVSPDDWTKSGAILNERIQDGPFAGKYVMYFGESSMWLGYSDDLLHWEYVSEPVMRARPDKQDNYLVEPGPPPIRTRDGILLLYNGVDRRDARGLEGPGHRPYRTFAALFDPENPTRVLARTDHPLLEPTQEWELEGYVGNVVFSESLVEQDGRWMLYYGGADRRIGLAEAEVDPRMLQRK
ncbi:MAG: glycosidase [Armatimonadetes bacterium]|nr:glycosidase [Armatimonadota bacterium]